MRAVASILACLPIVCATAAAANLWDHNGSTMALKADGAARKFIYEKPRSGLPVRSGTVLFSGYRKGNEYFGTAFTFSTRCGAAGFKVSGSIGANEKSVTLYGRSPLRHNRCRIRSYRDEALVFTLQPEKVEYTLKIGKDAFGFHIPQKFLGRTFYAVPPSNEHTIYSVEDMLSAIGAGQDILVAETTTPIENAYAAISGFGTSARRMIVFDDRWFASISMRDQVANYRVVLAHEIGHHLCRHTLGEFRDQPHAKELQADRAAGAILRKAHDSNRAIGGGVADLETIIRTVNATMSISGSETHPPRAQRMRAFLDGWNWGSDCVTAHYVPINLPPPHVPSAAERIVLRYGNELTWFHNHWTGSYAYVRTVIEGSSLRIIYDHPTGGLVAAGVRRGTLLFDGTSDATKIRGTFYHYVAGCPPVKYHGEGSFVENNGIFLAGPLPKMNGCTVTGYYNSTLHLFKNTSDWGFRPPQSRR